MDIHHGYCAFFCSYIAWRNTISSAYAQVTEIAHNVANQLDQLIGEVFNEINYLPLADKHLDCHKDLLPFLQRMMSNHPEIAGVIIHNTNKQISCSTLAKNTIPFLKKNGETMSGPLNFPVFTSPAFSVQKTIEHHVIELIILVPVLKEILNNTESCLHSVILRDENTQKNIIDVKDSQKRESWLYNQLVAYHFPMVVPVSGEADLSALKGIEVAVTPCNRDLFFGLWYNQILLGIIVFFLSGLLYFLTRNILHKHYSLLRAIKKAIKKKQFYPLYQPLYDISKQRFSGAEVLLRWQGSNNEIITPDFFIQEAEDSGLILPISLQIIKIALRDTQLILKRDSDFHLSFNICAMHFTDTSFFKWFDQTIAEYGISPQQILLEVTERELLDQNNELYISCMHELRNKGFSLAIDDYGTGHASISYLQFFPFNYLKIDKIFIHAIGTNAITESLNSAIITLANKLGLTIIAEGVETKEQAHYLLENGIKLLQGWYFSKALSIEQLKHLLQGEKNESF